MQSKVMGSPPRMRGKAVAIFRQLHHGRITPAYAGKRDSIPQQSSLRRDHPRVCGEKEARAWPKEQVWGSPPRMRGKARGAGVLDVVRGITPACAGKSSHPCRQKSKTRDHPRVCGEKQRTLAVQDEPQGSPPRVRGKVWRSPAAPGTQGITPACAGKRRPVPSPRSTRQDHPRVCGEKPPKGCGLNLILGSPPRVRGKAAAARAGLVAVGITPACAGKSAARTD